jgi:hypothetical protein
MVMCHNGFHLPQIESGPFVIEHWQKGSMMSLVPNSHAFQAPKLERIILQIIPDASTRRIVLERGDVDFAVHIATKDIPDLRQTSGVKVLSYPSARGWWLGMTWNKAPFNNYGVSPRAIVYKFALKNALMPVVTLIGLQVGFLIGGVVLVEVVFSLPGIGRYAVESLLVNDFAPVQGFVLLVLVVYLLVNLLVDLLYSVLNPQVRNG